MKRNTTMSEEAPTKRREVELPPADLYLTDDLALDCLARVSRSDHAALSVASKRYRSLVASPDLYQTRSLMALTETNVYVCLRIPHYPSPGWYILRRRKTLDGGGDLIPIPTPPNQAPEASSVVVVDWGIYVIGGMKKRLTRTSDVWVLDCRTHTWSRLPSMGEARAYAAAGVVDGKIYVLGGCSHGGCTFGEVFDLKTQTWDDLPPAPMIPHRISEGKIVHDCFVRDSKIYVVEPMLDDTFYYSPRQGDWGKGNWGNLTIANHRDWCMVDNLIYSVNRNGSIFWWEAADLDWRRPLEWTDRRKVVKGLGSLEGFLRCSRAIHFGEYLRDQWESFQSMSGNTNSLLRRFGKKGDDLGDFLPGARLINSGGNIVLFWDVVKGDDCLEIWCAEISLERRRNRRGGGEVWGNIVWSNVDGTAEEEEEEEVWGNIEWSNVVMTVNPFIDRYKVLYSVSVTL